MHRDKLVESHMSHAEILGLIPDERDTKFRSLRDMLRKHERFWPGQLGELNVTEMKFDLVQDRKPFKYT